MIRPYHIQDKDGIIALLRANTPQYFHPSEEPDLIEYLDRFLQDYFVVEKNSQIVGAGGINYFPETNSARLSWDLISPDCQGKGIGRTLALYRINRIKEVPRVENIVVRTTQLAYQFYAKVGFDLQYIEKDYWAEGFDLYEMVYKKTG